MNKFRTIMMNHPVILKLLWSICRGILQLISLFIPLDEKLIVFCSYGGRKYDDSPKALYEYIKNDKRFNDYKLAWVFINPDSIEDMDAEKIKMNTAYYWKILVKAKVWIDNTGGIDHGIEFTRRGVIKVQTWHGSPIKKICGDENNGTPFAVTNKFDANTIRCSLSDWDQVLFARLFNCDKECIIKCGLPRNDELKDYSEDRVSKIKKHLGIPKEKKVILYMPTYREYQKSIDGEVFIKPSINIKKWKDILEEEYVILFRAHYETIKLENITFDQFIVNVSDYPYVNDLYIASDLMISDYSSSFFDYSMTQKPFLCYAYDLEEYSQKRGLYFDLSDLLPCPIDHDEDSLINNIVNIDKIWDKEKMELFRNKYTCTEGQATKRITDAIYKQIIG